jgi:prokaryotic ubiquitin-like protein Pup
VILSGSVSDDRVKGLGTKWRLDMATRDTGGQKQTTRREEEVDEVQTAPTEDVQERQEKLADDVDAILDEIDEVLEENAEEFVRSYVQKGGE